MPSATARPCPTGVLLASRRAARRSSVRVPPRSVSCHSADTQAFGSGHRFVRLASTCDRKRRADTRSIASLGVHERSVAARHHYHLHDSLIVEGQAHRDITLIRDLTRFTPPDDLMRSRNNVASDLLKLRLRLFGGELLISARLLKHLSACRNAEKTAARRDGFDIGIE
jgi:hypothetical protein